MKRTKIVPAWGKILCGHRPFLSIEITRECPLRCPGCYAYEPEHLPGNVPLRQLRDLQGEALIEGVLRVVRRHRPLHLSLVGGEPLVRYRELDVLLPRLDAMNVEVQLVTGAVRPIPRTWGSIPCLHLVVSIDGLQPEHDRRRAWHRVGQIVGQEEPLLPSANPFVCSRLHPPPGRPRDAALRHTGKLPPRRPSLACGILPHSQRAAPLKFLQPGWAGAARNR